jgi:hypothetical protein
VNRRLLTAPVALLLAVFLGAARTTLTSMYFPPSDSGSALDIVMRGQFAAILAETKEPILHEPRGNTYAVRVTAYTVRGSVTFLRFERKADGRAETGCRACFHTVARRNPTAEFLHNGIIRHGRHRRRARLPDRGV